VPPPAASTVAAAGVTAGARGTPAAEEAVSTPGATAPAPAAEDGAPSATEKPSPRDVARGPSGAAARPRRMPLDEEEGWFGCQVAAIPATAGSSLAALAPVLFLLLAGRRRRI
jgi:MYXO-CTERM domain-containing protein